MLYFYKNIILLNSMEENLNNIEKNNDNINELSINDFQNDLDEEKDMENKKENIPEKEQINEYDINNFSELINKIKYFLEDKNEIKAKNKDNKRGSKQFNNIETTKKPKAEHINIIIPILNEFIDFLSKKNLEEKCKDLNLRGLSEILIKLQSTFFLNMDILTKIEIICNLLVNNLKNNEQSEIFMEIMVETLNYCENYDCSNVLITSLKLINNILKKYSYFIEPVYDFTIPKIYNVLDLNYQNEEMIQLLCYKILLLFIYNNVFSYDLVGKGLLSRIKELLNKIKKKIDNNELNNNLNINNEKKDLNNDIVKNNESNNANINDLIKQIYILLISLTNVDSNLIKISEELMEILLDEFLRENYSEDSNINIKILFFELLIEKEQKSIDIFIKYKGIECILKLMIMHEKNKDVILKLFHIINMILTYNKAYNEIMIKLKFHEYIKNIVDNLGNVERDIDFSGKSILFLIDFRKDKLEEVEEYDLNQIKLKKASAPPSYVINFLTNGKVVKIVNNLGEIKKKYLYFTSDFLKVIAKKVNSNLPPKQKYIIETVNINSVVKGYGTDAFKKSKRFYRALPEFNKCFSIIALHPLEGQKSINVICDKESEVDKWINYIKIIIAYLQENKTIKKNISFNNS